MARRRFRDALDAPEALGDLLARAGEGRFSPIAPALPPEVWRSAVGARVAERARPERLEAGVLHVHAATSAWASELSLLEADIVPRLQAHGVAVQRLRFRVTPFPAGPPPERRRTQQVPAPAELPDDLRAELEAIDDPALRETVAAAMARHLAWREHIAPCPAPPPAAARAPDGRLPPRSTPHSDDAPSAAPGGGHGAGPQRNAASRSSPSRR